MSNLDSNLLNSSSQGSPERRTFLRTLSLGIFALPFFSSLRGLGSLSALAAAPVPAGKTECKTTDPVASAIGYVVAPKDKKKPCDGCMFYGKVDANYGNCQLMPNCVVPAKASCNSFQPKA